MSLCVPDSDIDLVCCLRDFLTNAVSFALCPMDMGPINFCDKGLSLAPSNALSLHPKCWTLLGSYRQDYRKMKRLSTHFFFFLILFSCHAVAIFWILTEMRFRPKSAWLMPRHFFHFSLLPFPQSPRFSESKSHSKPLFTKVFVDWDIVVNYI